jgi:prefoldin alpha subunit
MNMSVSEDQVREMLTLLDRYKAQADMLNQQLAMLNSTEMELGAAWDFLESYQDIEDGTEVKVPIGGGVLVSASVVRPDRVITAVGDGINVELSPEDAAQRIGERRDQVREMIGQIKGNIEQIEASAQALQQQAEAAFQELQASRE